LYCKNASKTKDNLLGIGMKAEIIGCGGLENQEFLGDYKNL